MAEQSQDHIVTLGSKGGASMRPGTSMPSSNLLCMGGRNLVIDCGSGVMAGLLRQGMHLSQLSEIFITHLHSDHYLELGPLLYAAWTSGLKTPVVIYGPAALGDYWHNFLAAMAVDKALRVDRHGRVDLETIVSIQPVEEGDVATVGEIAVSALKTDHPPLRDTFAYRFSNAKKTVVFSGDTNHLPQMSQFAAGADVLVHEAMLYERVPDLLRRVGGDFDKLLHHITEGHTRAEDAGKTAAAAGVRKLVLNHLIPADDPACSEADWREAVEPHWSGDLVLARDGLRIGF